jgi:gluconate kinase
MKTAIAASQPINEAMRDEFFHRLIVSAASLHPRHPRMVVAQTFIKEKYRVLFLKHFSAARFILVEAEAAIREARLARRDHQPLDADYARRMALIFDQPHIAHTVIKNDVDGREHVNQQIEALLK